MKVEIRKFGEFLTSRPAGREAFLAMRAYGIGKNNSGKIEVDFSGVKMATLSWIDEFLSNLEDEYGKEKIVVLPTDNLSVTTAVEARE